MTVQTRGHLVFGIILVLVLVGSITSTAMAADESRRLVVSEQTVRDRKTGTVWVRNGNLPGKELTWLDAQAYLKTINQKNYGGYQDWGFPSKAALEELQEMCAAADNLAGDRKTCAELLNKNGFQNVQEGLYWSSSKMGRNNFITYAWSTIDGTFKSISKEQAANLLPVHGGR